MKLVLRPFQQEGVFWLYQQLKAKQKALLADEMGLGKTPQAIALIARMFKPRNKILIICPAFLKLNWRYEIEAKYESFNQIWLQIIDSAAQDPVADWVIVSFELASAMREKFISRQWDLLIIDESHYLKNPESGRTKNIFGSKKTTGIFQLADNSICLSGSPSPNGAHELFTVAKRLGDVRFSYASWIQNFTYDINNMRGRNKYNQFAFAPKGVRNEKELKAILATFMLRRLKKDVLAELPDKTFQIVPIGPDATLKKLIKEEQGYSIEDVFQAMPSEYNSEIEDLLSRSPFDLTPLARLRHEFGLAKVPHAIKILKDDLENGSVDKIVVFAWHREVCIRTFDALQAFNPVLVHGGISHKKRSLAVQQFQENQDCRVFVGQLKASGVGITLTAASNAFFIEPWYVPGDIDQAVDRLHRIGQHDAVNARFLIIENSLDEKILQTALDKVETLDKIYG